MSSSLFHQLHLAQLEAIKFPASLVSVLEYKILNFNNEASINEYFQIAEEIVESTEENEEDSNQTHNEIRKRQLVCLKDIVMNTDVFILDHVVSISDSELSMLENYLKDNQQLVERLNDMIIDRKQITSRNTIIEDQSIKNLINNLFQYMGCFCYNEKNEYNWYILDEVGNAINHSDIPNVVCHPFIYFNSKPDGTYHLISYSILWPIKDIHVDDLVTRDYISWVNNPKLRTAMLCDWIAEDEVEEELIDILMNEAIIYNKTLIEKQSETITTTTKLLTKEDIMNRSKVPPIKPCLGIDYIRVWCPSVNETELDPQKLMDIDGGLTDKKFQFVQEQKDADIIWEVFPYKDSNVWNNPKKRSDGLSNVLVNQFPYEGAFVMKDHLAREIIKNIGQPNWWNPTYDLEVLLTVFVGDYLLRKKENLNNIWIIKPANSTRSNGHIITDSLLRVIRSLETNKSRVAQKYINHPLLYKGRKFDLRFIVLVRNTFPLELYVYNVFWTRIANKNFNEYDIYDIESNYTAMHLINGIQPIEKYPDYLEFIHILENEYPSIVKWNEILDKIHVMIYELFSLISNGQPNHMYCEHARAMYGCDVMLEQIQHIIPNGSDNTDNTSDSINNSNSEPTSSIPSDNITIQPKLLEVTFSPSNNAISNDFMKKYNTFVNDCFNLLYYGIENNVTRLA